jgi:hypothetical protein
MEHPELRCIFVTLSPLLSAIVAQALSRAVKLRVLAHLGERHEIGQRVAGLSPDLVVIGLQSGESDALGATLLAQVPAAKVLLIGDAGNCAFLHEMRPYRATLFDFSPANLVAALLGAP